MNSSKFSINWDDIIQSLKTGLIGSILPPVAAVIAPILVALQAGKTPSFNIDWASLETGLRIGAYMTLMNTVKRFIQDESGSTGVWGFVVQCFGKLFGGTGTGGTATATEEQPAETAGQ